LKRQRKALGWNPADCSPARVWIKPKDEAIEQLIGRVHGRQSVHFLGGVGHGTLNRRVLSRLAGTGAIIGLWSEGADNRGVLGLARKAKYSLDRYLVEDKLDFIGAVGQLGVRWFESVGYDTSHIFSIIYVTERPVRTLDTSNEWNESQVFRMIYIGQIICRKDGPTAIRALAGLLSYDWQFDIVGNGPELERWERVAAQSGIASRVRFQSAVNNRMIGNLFEEADLLLLPSRFDGWGAVVNEALMCGVPVVCSDNCGAADLLRKPWRGSIFKTGSVESLRGTLQGWIENGKRNKESSARIREWSSVLEGPSMARYLVEIVEYIRYGGMRPSPPWY
jgi:glycosyltransferase involved in cell wall biosynthesis